MVGICLDNKHISVNQLQMVEDRILQCHICNLLGPLSPLIKTYLRETSFLHATLIGRGCKLDLKLIRALVERLPVDGLVVSGSVQSVDWGTICYDLFDVVTETIYGGQIEMAWLRNNFAELAEDSTKERRECYAWVYIFQIIGGLLMPDKSRNLIHLRWLLKLIDFNGAGELSWGSTVLATLYREMCQATKQEKIKIGGCLLLLQSWARYRFPFLRPRVDYSYTFLLAPLVVYTTVEMHKANRVLWPFRFQQSILVAPQVLDDLHCIDLRQPDTYWLAFHSQYINIWNNRYDFLPTRDAILVPELAYDLNYIPWFRIHGKPYLLGEEARR
ncbi:hypothetical protein Gotur_008343 [Gossypium turneri]